MTIVALYLIEFIYNLATHPPPKASFFQLYFTWVDLITMATPIVSVFLDSNTTNTASRLKIIRILRVSKVIRILRLVKVIKRYTVL